MAINRGKKQATKRIFNKNRKNIYTHTRTHVECDDLKLVIFVNFLFSSQLELLYEENLTAMKVLENVIVRVSFPQFVLLLSATRGFCKLRRDSFGSQNI